MTGRRGRPLDPSAIDLTLPLPSEEANIALITGTIMEMPTRDRSRNGDPVTVLLLGFPAPDERGRHYSACVDIEILDSIVGTSRNRLRKGQRLVVLGRLTGEGGLWAMTILLAMPAKEVASTIADTVGANRPATVSPRAAGMSAEESVGRAGSEQAQTARPKFSLVEPVVPRPARPV